MLPVGLLALGACGASTAEAGPSESGGEASCEDRVRARPVCLRAVEDRCGSMRGTCEASCEPRLGPGSSERDPALRRDIAADRCREGCRENEKGCRAALLARCPVACPDAG